MGVGFRRACAAAWFASQACGFAPWLVAPRPASALQKKTRGEIVSDDAGEPDDEMMAELRERMLAEELKSRSSELREGGSNRLAAQYVMMLTQQHPSELVRDFYSNASPAAQGAMQDAIVGLLGAGAVDAEFTTVTKLAVCDAMPVMDKDTSPVASFVTASRPWPTVVAARTRGHRATSHANRAARRGAILPLEF